MSKIDKGVRCLVIGGANVGKTCIVLRPFVGDTSMLKNGNIPRWHVQPESPFKYVSVPSRKMGCSMESLVIRERHLLPIDPTQELLNEQKEAENASL